MQEPAPVQLSELLRRLGLATERDLLQVEPTVHRLAGDLPRFQSVWIDALRQARLLTQFQAAAIMAGRGDELRIGRYVLCHIVQECIYWTAYKAEDCESHEPFRLTVCSPESTPPADLLPSIEKLIVLGQCVPDLSGHVTSAGQDGARLWAASTMGRGNVAGGMDAAPRPLSAKRRLGSCPCHAGRSGDNGIGRPGPRRHPARKTSCFFRMEQSVCRNRGCGQLSAPMKESHTAASRPKGVARWRPSGSHAMPCQLCRATYSRVVVYGGKCFAAGRRWAEATL